MTDKPELFSAIYSLYGGGRGGSFSYHRDDY